MGLFVWKSILKHVAGVNISGQHANTSDLHFGTVGRRGHRSASRRATNTTTSTSARLERLTGKRLQYFRNNQAIRLQRPYQVRGIIVSTVRGDDLLGGGGGVIRGSSIAVRFCQSLLASAF